MAKQSTIHGESTVPVGAIDATHKQVCQPTHIVASRMIKNLSNKSLRNLMLPNKDKKKTNIANESSSAAITTTSRATHRPRSHTFETLERQRRDEGQQFRPRSDLPNKDMIKSISSKSLRNLLASSVKANTASAATESSLTKSGRPRSHTLEMLEKQRRDDGKQFRPRSEYMAGRTSLQCSP